MQHQFQCHHAAGGHSTAVSAAKLSQCFNRDSPELLLQRRAANAPLVAFHFGGKLREALKVWRSTSQMSVLMEYPAQKIWGVCVLFCWLQTLGVLSTHSFHLVVLLRNAVVFSPSTGASSLDGVATLTEKNTKHKYKK
eukprot:5530217-Amphidinium_carterae.1